MHFTITDAMRVTTKRASAVAVFARAPRLGAVKTRLETTLGTVSTLAVYRRLLARALTCAAASQAEHAFLYAAQANEVAYFERQLEPTRWRVATQTGADLGARMANCFAELLAAHRAVVVIGSDIADMHSDDLNAAFAALQGDHECVIGPSADGGYWLIGLRAPQPNLFCDISWSSATVYAETRTRITASGMSCAEVALRHDIDEAADLAHLR